MTRGLERRYNGLDVPGGDEPGMDAMGRGSLAGKRILIVEDETLVAMMLEDMLEQFGCEVVGIAPRLAQAKAISDSSQFDCALLDVNLAGETVYPFAERLSERGTPFVFVTGYDRPELMKRFRGRPVLRKPFEAEALERALIKVLAPDRSARASN